MKVGIIGSLGYHESNITGPIMAELHASGHVVERIVPRNVDWFTSEGQKALPGLASGLAQADLSGFDALLFVDAWSFVLPIVLWNLAFKTFTARPLLAGILLGSTEMEGDVACAMPRARQYENFLFEAFDVIFTHGPHEAHRATTRNTGHPMPQFARKRPARDTQPKRVVYAHRWSADKGKDDFLALVRYSLDKGLGIDFVVTDAAAQPYVTALGVVVAGWQSQAGLREIGALGGYAWAGAKSELAAYALHDLISYGLAPLVSTHDAYQHIPSRFSWGSAEGAARIVDTGDNLSPHEWRAMGRSLVGAEGRIVDALEKAYRGRQP